MKMLKKILIIIIMINLAMCQFINSSVAYTIEELKEVIDYKEFKHKKEDENTSQEEGNNENNENQENNENNENQENNENNENEDGEKTAEDVNLDDYDVVIDGKDLIETPGFPAVTTSIDTVLYENNDWLDIDFFGVGKTENKNEGWIRFKKLVQIIFKVGLYICAATFLSLLLYIAFVLASSSMFGKNTKLPFADKILNLKIAKKAQNPIKKEKEHRTIEQWIASILLVGFILPMITLLIGFSYMVSHAMDVYKVGDADKEISVYVKNAIDKSKKAVSNGSNGKIVVLDPGHGPSLSGMSDEELKAEGYVQYNGVWGEWRHWKNGTYGESCEHSGCANTQPPADEGRQDCFYNASSGNRDIEPEIDYANATAAKKYLEQMGYTVRLTRDANHHPSFSVRSSYCFPNRDTSAEPDASIYVCIHSDGGGGTGTKYVHANEPYTQKYVSDDYADQCNRAGQIINDKIIKETSLELATNPDWQAGYLIAFNKNPVPTAYMEIGFYDKEESILKEEADKIGLAIAEGVDEYLGGSGKVGSGGAKKTEYIDVAFKTNLEGLLMFESQYIWTQNDFINVANIILGFFITVFKFKIYILLLLRTFIVGILIAFAPVVVLVNGFKRVFENKGIISTWFKALFLCVMIKPIWGLMYFLVAKTNLMLEPHNPYLVVIAIIGIVLLDRFIIKRFFRSSKQQKT